MNKALQRQNEFKQWRKRIYKKYGADVSICDHHSYWTISRVINRGISKYKKYECLWTGEKLRNA